MRVVYTVKRKIRIFVSTLQSRDRERERLRMKDNESYANELAW